ncbi:MAG TPA: lamin tail domain-containing protein [Verrucomicrobiales bacterium]|nr:lamin tail domain-containing protein [Verrucomicrobiales bacterium]
MNRSLSFARAVIAGLVFACAAPLFAGVDSVVTFNEIQYHPTAAQTAGEWIELKNQNSTDVDLSGWRLDGGVDYVFPAGTVIRGGKYLVVAANPAALMAATGLTGVVGPFENILANNGESVTLKNNNGRRMDEISWNDKEPWPVAADGSGATLSKIQELHDSGTPENWRASVEVGGTPGVFNFTEQVNGGTTVQNGLPGALARYYKVDGNTTDGSGNGFNATLIGPPPYSNEFPPIVGSGQSIDCNGASQYMQITDANHPSAYTIGAWVKPDVIKAQSIVVRTDGSGPTTSWSHQLRMNATGRFEHYTFDGAAKTITGTTVAVVGQWYHVTGVAANGGQMRLYVNGTEEGAALGVGNLWSSGTRWLVGSNSGNAMGFFDGRIDEIAFWLGPMDASQVGHIATGFRLPTDGAVINRALGRAVIAGSGAYPNLAFNGISGSGDFSAGNVTDGSASDVLGASYWLGRDGITNESFVLDLGNPVEISQILLRNTHHTQFNDRGTAGFRLLASSAVDGANQPLNPVEILNGTLTTRTIAAPTPAGSPVPADSFTSANGLTPVTARYLKFEALTSAYVTNVGLNEIEVFGNPQTGGGTGNGRTPPAQLAINELTAAGAGPFWLELFNYGAAPFALGGCVLETSTGASYTFPAGSMAAGSFQTVQAPVLGFTPADGDKIFLFSPGRTNVIDGAVVKLKHQARKPGLTGGEPGGFLSPALAAEQTPGNPNQITLNTAIVINEIMYHRRPQFLPYVENPEEWVELYNRSANAVSLDGWRMDGGFAFDFPPGTSIAPGAYLCVSNDMAAFSAAHPGVPVAGNFSGGLSNRGDQIILRDDLGNAVDEVFYRDKEPWPLYTDGLGSSIELRNPDMDNSVPESWAASDESTRSAWQNYTVTATAATPIYSATVNPSPGAVTSFHELRMGLLEEGEVLVDDVSVREITTAPGTELMQNGAFTAGNTAAWRLLGNHETSDVITDAGNPVLRLRALGPLLYMHNLLETSLKSGTALMPVVNGRQYTISLRAKWLRGCPWLHTEFYYNKVAKTFLLDLPATSGTPGAQNSVYAANTGPAFSLMQHAPVVPNANQPVTVTARVTDPQGVGSVTLRYSVNGAAFLPVTMTAGAAGFYSGVIPGQAVTAITQFYLEATDTAGAISTWPAKGVNSRALIKGNEGAAVANKQNLRVITTAADAAQLASTTNMMSNRLRGCTIVHNEREVFYDGTIRLRGSMYSRSNSSQAGESIHFPSDHLFRGTQRTVSARRSGMNEIIVKHAINRAGRLPDNYNDVIHLISFRSDIVGPARMEMERFNNSWLDEFYPEGSDGTLFKLEGIRDPSQTFANGTIPAGNPEGIKNYTTSGMGWIVNLDLADLGPDGEQYRHGFRFLNNFSRNDNARFVQLCRALSLPVSTVAQQQTFETTIEALMDVDEWMRTFAMMSLFTIGDVYSQPPGTVGNISNPHNLNFYMPPTPDGKIAAIPWDWNFVFSGVSLTSNGGLSGDKNIQKVISRPKFKRLFLGNFKNLIETSFNAAYMNPWLAHYGSLTGEGYTGYAANITNRGNAVLNQINSQIPPVGFSITTNAGADFSVNGANAVLEGDGWVDVFEIRLNGSPESLPVTWTDQNSWMLTVPLGAGVNNVVLTAHNRQGTQIGTDTIVITNTSPVEQAGPDNIVISEIHYHPLAGEEFIEIMNISATNQVDLSGCAFTNGIEYNFAPGTLLNAGARMVINGSQFLNASALSNGGERVTLEAPGGVIIKTFAYDDEPPWPAAADGTGPSLVLIAPLTNPNHELPQNWRLSTAAGGNPGGEDVLHFTGNPAADDDLDGWNNLLEYALGASPVITSALTSDGLTFTITRAPNSDDAEILGEVSSALTGWTPADLVASSATTLTYRVPEALLAEKHVYLRATVRLRP